MPTDRPDPARETERAWREPELPTGGIDPRLHAAWLRRAARAEEDGHAHAECRVAVLARLHREGDAPPGLEIRVRNGCYVTGTIDVRDFVAVRGHVHGLKLTSACGPAAWDWRAEIGISPSRRVPRGDSNLNGEGVIVGAVDVDCAFAHPTFQDALGNTRFVAFWDQRTGGDGRPPKRYGYGRVWGADEINQAVRAVDPYRALGYDAAVSRDPSHGTQVLALAAGSEGVARGAGLVFVQIAPETKIDIPSRRSLSLCDSARLVEAVQFIFDVADELHRPAVVNISLAGQAGPHDGSSFVEKHFDEMLKVPGRAIVLVAGNGRRTARHAKIEVVPGTPSRLYWWVPPHDPSANELDAWYSGDAKLVVRAGLAGDLPPAGDGLPMPDPEWTRALRPGGFSKMFSKARVAGVRGTSRYRGSVHHRGHDSQNGDNEVFAYLVRTPMADAVSCVLEFENEGDSPAVVHAWVDNDEDGRSAFYDQTCEKGTISGIATGQRPIVVGSYRGSTLDGSAAPSEESSIGPARGSGRYLPDLCAAGEDVSMLPWEPGGPGGLGYGTSFAAPQVAGMAALLLQQRPHATCEEVRQALQDGASRPDTATPRRGIEMIGAGYANLRGALRAWPK
jgi:subtilisin family serine protease